MLAPNGSKKKSNVKSINQNKNLTYPQQLEPNHLVLPIDQLNKSVPIYNNNPFLYKPATRELTRLSNDMPLPVLPAAV